jgi:precorrin-6B methylase 1
MNSFFNNSPCYGLLLLLVLICSNEAFLSTPSIKSTTSRISADSNNHIFLFVDTANSDSNGGNINNGKVEYSRETIESSKKNEWGIPSSDTLEPFSDTPKDTLGNGGRMTLVGSGPGDPDLLTLKAYKLLQDPDALIISDRLVSQEILDLVKGEIKVARKMPGCAEFAQEEIYFWAYEGLAAGKHVVRLKIGDPFVFGRGGEEVIQFRKFGVESKVVPVSFSVCRRRRRLSTVDCRLSTVDCRLSVGRSVVVVIVIAIFTLILSSSLLYYFF